MTVVDPPPPGPKATIDQLEAYLWGAADKLRGKIDSSDYKSFIFGFLFLKRLSDVFEEEAEKLIAAGNAPEVAWEDRDYHRFYVPKRARWSSIQKQATGIGDYLNKACAALEEENTSLEGVLRGIDYNDENKLGHAKERDELLARLVIHFSKVSLRSADLAEPDVLGSAYEYLIERFADDTGKKGGEFYTPRKVVQLIVELLQPEGDRPDLRPDRRLGRHAHRVRQVRRAPRRRPAQAHAPRPGEQPRDLGDLQDEHAAARPAGRADREGRHYPKPEAGEGRRAGRLRHRHRQPALQSGRLG